MSFIVPLPPLSKHSLVISSFTQPKEQSIEPTGTFSDIFFKGTVGEISKSLNSAAKASEMALKQPGVDSLKTALEVLNTSTAVRQGTTILSTALQSYREVSHMAI
jgi:flagellar hook-basal body complex protein FliE